MDNLTTRVISVIRSEVFGPLADVQTSHRLDQLDASVFYPVCVSCSLDEEFGIELRDGAIEGAHTVADVIATVRAAVEAEQRAKVEG